MSSKPVRSPADWVSGLFPEGLVEETIQTLALLFPQLDRQITGWMNKLPQTLNIDKELTKCGRLKPHARQIGKFRFWHDRLVLLKQAYDQSQPRTISQLWYDRRNTLQWYTFWIAISVFLLAIVFGMVQSIEGALQTYKAYHPTSAAKTQL
jgi:hypothetical protein